MHILTCGPHSRHPVRLQWVNSDPVLLHNSLIVRHHGAMTASDMVAKPHVATSAATQDCDHHKVELDIAPAVLVCNADWRRKTKDVSLPHQGCSRQGNCFQQKLGLIKIWCCVHFALRL